MKYNDEKRGKARYALLILLIMVLIGVTFLIFSLEDMKNDGEFDMVVGDDTGENVLSNENILSTTELVIVIFSMIVIVSIFIVARNTKKQ